LLQLHKEFCGDRERRSKLFATGMASAYHEAVIRNLPKAKRVFDRFHIVKLMNDQLIQLRRDVQSEAEMMNRQVLSRQLLGF
jgi:transposase